LQEEATIIEKDSIVTNSINKTD
jgi:hypothetical protein